MRPAKQWGCPTARWATRRWAISILGAGRIVYQDLTRINVAIRDGSFNRVPALVKAMETVKEKKSKLHVIGLFGPGGVHSHSDHMYAIFDMANDQGIEPILHIITDGRDTPPESSLDFLTTLEAYQLKKDVVVASVSGRYYTMDSGQTLAAHGEGLPGYRLARGRPGPHRAIRSRCHRTIPRRGRDR